MSAVSIKNNDPISCKFQLFRKPKIPIKDENNVFQVISRFLLVLTRNSKFSENELLAGAANIDSDHFIVTSHRDFFLAKFHTRRFTSDNFSTRISTNQISIYTTETRSHQIPQRWQQTTKIKLSNSFSEQLKLLLVVLCSSHVKICVKKKNKNN